MTIKFNYATVVTGVALALAVALLLSLTTCGRGDATTAAQLKAYRDSTHYLINQLNQVIASRRVVVGTPEQVGQFYNLDSIARQFNQRADEVQASVWWLRRQTSALTPVAPPRIVYRDTGRVVYRDDTGRGPTVAYMEQDFSNPYTQLRVRVGDSAYAKLTAYDTLHVTQSRAFKRRLFTKEWYTTIGVKNANPDVRDTLVGAFQIREATGNAYLDLRVGAAAWSTPFFRGATLGAEAEWGRGRWSATLRYDRSLSKEFLIGRLGYRVIRL